MLYRHEKACKELASKGFLDIRTFLAVKEKGRRELEANECDCEHERRDLEGGGSRVSNPSNVLVMADWTICGDGVDKGGEGDEDDIVLIPSPSPRIHPQTPRGGACATVSHPGLGHAVLKRHELAEEYKSGSDEEDGDRNVRHTKCLRVQSPGRTDEQPRAAAVCAGPLAVKTQHDLAEEHESVSDEEEGDRDVRRTKWMQVQSTRHTGKQPSAVAICGRRLAVKM